jgi:hypothetical protein
MPFAQSFDKSQVSFLFLPRYRSWAAPGRARTKEGAANALFAKDWLVRYLQISPFKEG